MNAGLRKAGATRPQAKREKHTAEDMALTAAERAGGTFINRPVNMGEAALYFVNAIALLEVLAITKAHGVDEDTVADALWGIRSLIDRGHALLFGEEAKP
jgi:hypothetical protein